MSTNSSERPLRNKGRVFHALIDSGTVDCIFPKSIGTLIGIDVPSETPKTYFGLAQQAASGYLHEIKLQITGYDQGWRVDLTEFRQVTYSPPTELPGSNAKRLPLLLLLLRLLFGTRSGEHLQPEKAPDLN
ncbi:MAG: hypothetical protein LC770_08085 [Acidobacteria bacterium]|nr:hypothetical protein [Acidobacteriota bacterium]